MAEDQSQQQNAEPGYVVMTPEDVVLLSKKAAEEAINRYKAQSDDGDGGNLIGLDGKFVKQLQNTVGVFNALKDFSSSPLQKVVEEKVGQFAAGMVESAFSGPKSPDKKNIIETILNSQFAYGLGASLGNKSPELIEAMSRNLGKDKTQQIIDNVITKGTQGSRQIGGGQGSQQDNIELLLSLDPNNPEHIAAYSDSQGGLPPDVARKMLMIHQDAIIKRFGGDAKVQKSSVGQHTQQQRSQPPRAPMTERAPESIPEEPMQYNDYNEFPKGDVVQRNDVVQTNTQQPNTQGQPGGNSNNDMLEVMKKFSSDIGQAMSAMIEEISTLKGTVSQLRGEIDTIRSSGPMSSPISPPISPGARTGMQIPITVRPPVTPPSVARLQVTPPEPTQIKRQYVPPTTLPPIASPTSNQSKVVSYQPQVGSMVEQPLHDDLVEQPLYDGLIEQGALKPIDDDLHKEPTDQEIIAKPVEQEQGKSFEDIIGIREHSSSPEGLVDIKPKDAIQQSVQPIKSASADPDAKWTDDNLGRDIANARNTETLRKSAIRQKDITEELKKVVEEEKVVHIIKEDKIVPITKEDQKVENVIKTDNTISREEKRPITPIKRSEVHKKLIPSLKKAEDGIR